MYIITAKVSKRRIKAAILAAAALICAVILIIPNGEDYEYTSAEIGDAAARLEFLSSLGYEAAEVSEKVIRIPTAFDEVYSSYNGIQLECGYDLERYKGKKCTLYSYEISNYPGRNDVLADIIVFKDRIIGGSVYTAALDGFMHGLKPAAK